MIARVMTGALGYQGEGWSDVAGLDGVAGGVGRAAAVVGLAGMVALLAFSVVIFAVANAAGSRDQGPSGP